MMRCAIEPEKLNLENSGLVSASFAGAKVPVPVLFTNAITSEVKL